VKTGAVRLVTGRFAPGQSGNPAGRPRGSKNAPSIRKLIRPHAKKFVEALVALVKDAEHRDHFKAVELGVQYLAGRPAVTPIEDDDLDRDGSMSDEEFMRAVGDDEEEPEPVPETPPQDEAEKQEFQQEAVQPNGSRFTELELLVEEDE